MDFGGKYVNAARIGHGAAGTVYRAHSVVFDRPVAIKLFHGALDDQRLQRDFQRECQVLGRLGDHPHIVAVHDSGITDERRPYLVMAYYDLGSLPTDLTFEPGEAAGIAVAVAEALAAAHSQGVLHRDVKPQNVLRSSRGGIALADFGISVRSPAELTSAAATASYAAPEVLHDHQAAWPVSDVYSLAATVYTLLAGHPPHPPNPGETDLCYLQRVVDEPHLPLPPGTPQALAAVIEAGLAKLPAARPASAKAFGDAVRAAAVTGQLDLTPPSAAPEALATSAPSATSEALTAPDVPETPADRQNTGRDAGPETRPQDAAAFVTVTRTRGRPPTPPEVSSQPRGPRRRLLALTGAVGAVAVILVLALLLGGRGRPTSTSTSTSPTATPSLTGAGATPPATAGTAGSAATQTAALSPGAPPATVAGLGGPTPKAPGQRTRTTSPPARPAVPAPAPAGRSSGTSSSSAAKPYDGKGVLLGTPRASVDGNGIATLTATVQVNHSITFAHLQIAVRASNGDLVDPHGEPFDVAFNPGATVTSSRTISGSRHYIGGPFTAFLAYSIDGSTWVNGPATTFTAPG